MSCKQRVRTLISLTLSLYLCAFKASRAKSLAETLVEESNARSERTEGNNDFQRGKWRLVEQVILGSDELHTEYAAFVEETVPYSRSLKPGETGEAATSLSWTIGKVKRKPSSSASDAEDGYQADTGFPSGYEEAKGTILAPSFTSSPHYSAWLAMRPLVHCGYDFMTFTASGGGFFHLLVDRGEASPIPLFQLPSHCGYSVKTSSSDLQMMVPFNACYITQENGSYVLPMLWWDSPLKLSCPVQMIPPMAPSVFCSSHGLAVQIDGQEQDILMLGSIVNGGWGPFVSEDCAHQVSSNPGKLNFFISYSAPCITSADGLLQFIFDNQEYTLSCPVTHQSPYIPDHPPSPSDAKVPYVPDPVSPTPTFPLPPTPQPPTQEQIVHFPEYPIYPGFLYPQLAEVYPPGSQPTRPLQPTPGGPSGPQPGQQQQQQQQQHYPSGQFYPQGFNNLPAPTSPLQAKEKPQTIPQEPAFPQAICPPYSHIFCGYFLPYPNYHPLPLAHYPPPHSQVPQYPQTPPTVTTTTAAPVSTTTKTTSTPVFSPSRPSPQAPQIQCLMGMMNVFLPFADREYIQIRDQMKTWLPLSTVPRLCGYTVNDTDSGVILRSPLPACHSEPRTPTTISLPLKFWDRSIEENRTVDLQCPYQTTPVTSTPATPPPTPVSPTNPPVALKPTVVCSSHLMTVELPSGPVSGVVVKECNLPSEQRLPCGPGSVSQPQCLSIGCCFSEQPPACYYPMDVCTIDRHFVFSVPASLTEPPLSPALLVAAGNATCVPARVTSDYALFKIPMNDCGARRVMVAKTVIYMVEIINRIQAISLNYGTITRDSPVRLLVECRYLPDTVVSASYMVKTPSLGPAIQIPGIFGVQLRIAKDAQYSSYYPQYHQPLEMLLGKPLYLEVRLLNAPDPALVLLVHYCVAYPRSGKAIWLLLYNGCPNPLDPAPQKTLVVDPQSPSPPAQTRRFTISTFQFLPDGEFKDMTEEV
ncbi:uncharacterized protein V6R79_023129 [Siganus canaliculatus]